MSVPLKRYHFNIAEFYRMADAGILTPDDRVELIEGEIIEMSPTGSHHAACVDRVNRLLNRLAGDTAIVRVQSPIRLNDFSEPQPDVALLRPREDFYERAHPTPDDVLLVVEVADSSAAYDRGVKASLYARSGVPEMWLLDLSRMVVEVYARPVGSSYQYFVEAMPGEFVTSETVAGLKLAAEDILG